MSTVQSFLVLVEDKIFGTSQQTVNWNVPSNSSVPKRQKGYIDKPEQSRDEHLAVVKWRAPWRGLTYCHFMPQIELLTYFYTDTQLLAANRTV